MDALLAGMEINILPVDGVYYEWHDGDGLNGVADVYKVKPEDIIDFPGTKWSMELSVPMWGTFLSEPLLIEG